MNCRRFGQGLADAAAGAPIPAVLEAHLASCEACRAELQALRHALSVVDAELSGLAAEEPSPDFVARVRQAAGSEPARSAKVGWLWPATAVAVTLIAALAIWVGRAPLPEARVTVKMVPTSSPAKPRDLDGPRSEAPDLPPAERVHTRRRGRQTPASPEVLVPPGEEEALVRLTAIVHRDGQLPPAFLATGQPSPDLAEPPPLEIAPLEIVPLEPDDIPGT